VAFVKCLKILFQAIGMKSGRRDYSSCIAFPETFVSRGPDKERDIKVRKNYFDVRMRQGQCRAVHGNFISLQNRFS
jgi:hypothetical protein